MDWAIIEVWLSVPLGSTNLRLVPLGHPPGTQGQHYD